MTFRTLLLRLLCWVLASLPLAAAATDLEIHGSNTIGAHLAPELVRGFLKQKTHSSLETQLTGVENEQVISTQEGQKEPLRVKVAAHGSSTGFNALKTGKADIWASSRPVKVREIQALADEVSLSSFDSEHVIAIDGLAILVHPDNPIEQLDIETLGKIFAGKIQRWSALGGPDRPINLYARDEKSGTWDTFKTLVLGQNYKLHPAAKRFESNDQLSDEVSSDPAGIGFTGLASVREAKLLAISEGAAPAMKPTRLSVATEDYPLSRRLFMYTKGSLSTPLAQEFIQYVLSDQGQARVPKAGFISQTPIAVTPEHDASVPATFKAMTQAYQRLSVNFRFREGGWRVLDNKAQRDLIRIHDYLKQAGKAGSELILIGFADLSENNNELRAQMISELRALTVERALKKVGIQVRAYTGYGHYMPVGAQGGDRGTQRNGRVEVWIRDRTIK